MGQNLSVIAHSLLAAACFQHVVAEIPYSGNTTGSAVPRGMSPSLPQNTYLSYLTITLSHQLRAFDRSLEISHAGRNHQSAQKTR